MSDIKLVIKISEELYEAYKGRLPMLGDAGMDMIAQSIANGIPLDKIRAEILEEKECAYADFERYKVEYLGQDWEDAYDSLPQDDFRYGMARCIEIIDKYKAESED